MSYVYGPLPSRRLGKSLGVDPIPLKTCNWNCVYCQLGRSPALVNERREWTPRAEVVEEVLKAVAGHAPGEIDYISFVGSGEPTLHSGLGWMIRAVKAQAPIPVAVITNGALLDRADVRDDLLTADVVMPTLITADELVYRRVHRPHPDLSLAAMIRGLSEFRLHYRGALWVEVMLLRGVNDTVPMLEELAQVLARIAPDQVHLTLPDRPPTEPWVEIPDEAALMRATAILGSCVTVVHPIGNGFDLSGHDSLLEAILAILARHPMSEEQLNRALAHSSPQRAAEVLEELGSCERARLVTRHGVRFWTVAEQRFAETRGEQHVTVAPAMADGPRS